MARPKSDFSKKNRISLRVNDNDLNNLYSVKKAGDFKDDSETIRFCITFSNIVLNMLPAAIVESFIELSEPTITVRNEPNNDELPSPTETT